jgi:hypothetical protein
VKRNVYKGVNNKDFEDEIELSSIKGNSRQQNTIVEEEEKEFELNER